MTQAHGYPTRPNDEVLHFWAKQANQQRAAFDAFQDYLNSLSRTSLLSSQ